MIRDQIETIKTDVAVWAELQDLYHIQKARIDNLYARERAGGIIPHPLVDEVRCAVRILENMTELQIKWSKNE